MQAQWLSSHLTILCPFNRGRLEREQLLNRLEELNIHIIEETSNSFEENATVEGWIARIHSPLILYAESMLLICQPVDASFFSCIKLLCYTLIVDKQGNTYTNNMTFVEGVWIRSKWTNNEIGKTPVAMHRWRPFLTRNTPTCHMMSYLFHFHFSKVHAP